MTNRWRYWRTYIAATTTITTATYTGSAILAAGAGVVTYTIVAWPTLTRQIRAIRLGHNWWAEQPLVDALITAEIVPKPSGDQPRPAIRRKGKPQHTDGGTSIKIELPRGTTYSKVKSRRAHLASAFGVPRDRIDLTQNNGDPENVITIWIGTKQRPPRVAAVAGMTIADWNNPPPIGRDDRGRDVYLQTHGTHTAFIGCTGSGKTWLGRAFVAPAILDPTVRLFAIIAKDNVNDWQPMEPVCDMYVGGVGKVALRRIEDLLLQVETEAERRQAIENPPAIILVVEEWYRVRQNANRLDPTLAKRLNGLMGELLATARSANIHIVKLGQRGTVEYLPGDQRANLMQRVVGKTSDEAEVRYVLGAVPQHLPASPGEFLISTDEQAPVLVRVDVLDDAAFAALCKRAATRNPITTATEVAAVVTDPLLDAVLAVLPERGASATTLFAELPDQPWRPANPIALGRALGKYPQLTARATDRGRLWCITGPASVKPRSAPVVPSVGTTDARRVADRSPTG